MNGLDVIKVYIDGLIRAGLNVPEDVKQVVDKLWQDQLRVKQAVDAQPQVKTDAQKAADKQAADNREAARVEAVRKAAADQKIVDDQRKLAADQDAKNRT